MTKTITPATAASTTVATATPADTATILRNALASIDSGANAANAASETLRQATLTLFAGYAQRAIDYIGTTTGTLPSTEKRRVQGLIWLDATGDRKPVKSANRSSGQHSLAQYLSEFTKVACDPVYGGIEALGSVELSKDTYETILDADKAERELKAIRDANIAAADLTEWVATLPATDRNALKRARELMTGDSVGCVHAAAYVATFDVE